MNGTRALLELLLDAEVVCMPALLLPAVLGTGRQARVALAADHFLAVECLGQSSEGRVIDATTQTQHQMQGRLLLDVIV